MENYDDEIKAMLIEYELLLKKYDDAVASDKSFDEQLVIFSEIKNLRYRLSILARRA